MTQETTAVATAQTNQVTTLNAFSNLQSFELIQRMANLFAKSNLVPTTFRGDIGACVIALNMANRMGADPLQVMQSLYVVHGKPAFSAQFLIACFNQSGKFSPITYTMHGTPGQDDWGCSAHTTDKRTGEKVDGMVVTIAMAKAEGWYGKAGSKWKTMPELMMRYRAATFLIRTVAPEISLGFQTVDEVRDVLDVTDQSSVVIEPTDLQSVVERAIVDTATGEVGSSTENQEQPQGAEPQTIQFDEA